MATNYSAGHGLGSSMSQPFLFYSRKVFAYLHVLLFLLGIPGNTLLLLILILGLRRKSGSRIARLTEPLLTNIVALDLFFILCNGPIMFGHAIFKDWRLGYLLCVTHHSLSLWITFADFYSMLAVSVLRYVSVIHPTQTMPISPKQIILACICICLVCLLFSIPLWINYGITEVDGETFCVNQMASEKTKLYLRLLGGVGFLPPMLLMIFCYSRIIFTLRVRRKLSIHAASSLLVNWRATVMALVTMVAFVVMSLPYWILVLFTEYDELLGTVPICLVYNLTSLLAFANHCTNPIICFCLSYQFQARLRNLFRQPQKGIGQLGPIHVHRIKAVSGI